MRQKIPGYHLRQARNNDIIGLQEIEARADSLFSGTGLLDEIPANDHIPDAAFHEAIAQALCHVIADPADKAVGFTLCSLRGTHLYLDQISVDPDHARKGLGAALIGQLDTLAARHACDQISLSTFRNIPWNGPYYQRHGFQMLDHEELEPWMVDLEQQQSTYLDVSKRCFMQKSPKLSFWARARQALAL